MVEATEVETVVGLPKKPTAASRSCRVGILIVDGNGLIPLSYFKPLMAVPGAVYL